MKRETVLVRNRFFLHLGITLISLVPGAVIAIVSGSFLYAALFIAALNLLAVTAHHFAVVSAYHVLKPFARFLGQEGFAPERMVIGLSSLESMRKAGGIPPERILLLLPHCLQNHECTHRITFDPYNCKKCGKCPVGDLVKLAERTGINIAVATGGTLARRHVLEKNPRAVIAVACPRDLGQGMLDAWPVPVYGIENTRPCGDCLDTRVDVKAIERVLEDLTS